MFGRTFKFPGQETDQFKLTNTKIATPINYILLEKPAYVATQQCSCYCHYLHKDHVMPRIPKFGMGRGFAKLICSQKRLSPFGKFCI